MAVESLHRKIITRLLILVVVMFGFTYAMVPIYKTACEVGWLDAKREEIAARNTQVDATRWVTVEFVANVDKELPWNFEPLQKSVRVRPGELTHIAYQVKNKSERKIVGQSIASYSPAFAGQYLRKIECFCFTNQPLNPNERKEMPVVFMVKPELPQEVNTITLSYTFFEQKSEPSSVETPAVEDRKRSM